MKKITLDKDFFLRKNYTDDDVLKFLGILYLLNMRGYTRDFLLLSACAQDHDPLLYAIDLLMYTDINEDNRDAPIVGRV